MTKSSDGEWVAERVWGHGNGRVSPEMYAHYMSYSLRELADRSMQSELTVKDRGGSRLVTAHVDRETKQLRHIANPATVERFARAGGHSPDAFLKEILATVETTPLASLEGQSLP